MILTKVELRAALGLASSISDAESALVELAISEAQSVVERTLQYPPENGSLTEILPVTASDEHASMSEWWESNGVRASRMWATRQGSNALQLKKLPVRSITNLWEDTSARHGSVSGSFANASKLTEGVGFEVEWNRFDSSSNKVCESGIIRRFNGSWPTLSGSVKVEYVAGYTADELNGTDTTINARPIKDAALALAVRSFRRYTVMGKQTVGGIFTAGPKQQERLGDYQYAIATTAGSVEQLTLGIAIPAEVQAMLQPFINYGWTFQ